MHIRRALLEDLRAQLKTLTGYGGVWIKRTEPTQNLARTITLFDDNEDVETLTIHAPARPQDRIVTVSVIGWVRGAVDSEKVESDMDDVAYEIENKLRRPTTTVGGIQVCSDMVLVGSNKNVSEQQSDLSSITLSYRLDYQTIEFAPSV